MREVVLFAGSDAELLQKCQALRYRVYKGDLGLDTPDLDHARQIDVETRDATCDFAAVVEEGAVLGCIRMQPAAQRPFYAELEFDLLGPSWAQAKLVEGARFAVTARERDGEVPLLLFQAFRRYCRERGVNEILSVAIVRGLEADRARLASLTQFVAGHTQVAMDRGRPARGYEIARPTPDELAGAARPSDVPPMLRLLANRRTRLCAPPAYCRRFGTFNFLLTTRLA